MADGHLRAVAAPTPATPSNVTPLRSMERAVDDQAEQAVLGAVLLDQDGALRVLERASAILSAEDFARPAHAVIWTAMLAVYARRTPLDVLTLADELRRMERLNTVGGAQYLGELTDVIPTMAHVEAHAGIVAEFAARRRMFDVAAEIGRAARDGTMAAGALRDLAVAKFQAARVPATRPGTLGEHLDGFFAEIEARASGTLRGGLSTGLHSLDALTRGLWPGLTVLAGRPSLGKTALALQWCLEEARRGGAVFFLSREMKTAEVLRRAVAYLARIPLQVLKTGAFTEEHMLAMGHAERVIRSLPFYIVDYESSGCPRSTAELVSAAKGVGATLVVVDHLKKLKLNPKKDRNDAMEELLDGLAKAGRQIGAPLVLIAHIGRGIQNGKFFRRPGLGDLFGGDTIGQNADNTLILHSEAIYPTRAYADGEKPARDIVEVIGAKLRDSGAMGDFCRLRFIGESMRFTDAADAPMDFGPSDGPPDQEWLSAGDPDLGEPLWGNR